MDCVFCKIVAGEIPAKKVYEDDYYLAFLDIAPITKGHVVVIPKEHTATYAEVSEEVAGELGRVLRKIAPQIVKLLAADGFNLGLNNGRAAGQIIDHIHWHIIPRYINDGLANWPASEQAKSSIEEVYNQLAGKLS